MKSDTDNSIASETAERAPFRLCPTALASLIALCFAVIALWIATYNTAERVNIAISDAALASVELFHWSHVQHEDHAGETGMNELMAASRRFSDAHRELSAVFTNDGWPDAPVYAAPAGTLAALLTIGRLPDDLSAIWRGGPNTASIDELMREQLTSCRALCTQPNMSPEDREAHLAMLEQVAVGGLTPRLRALSAAASAWKQRVLFYVRLATLLAGVMMICAILYTRFRVVQPLLAELNFANAGLADRNSQLAAHVAERTRDLERALKNATVAHDARTRFFASINHEMRTPLNGILGVADLLRSTDLTQSQRKLVDTIAQSGKTLVGHIDGVLEYVSLGSGRLVLHTRPISAPLHLAAVLDLRRPEAEDKGLTLCAEGLERDYSPVLVDSERLTQIASNLVGSAIKLTDTGGVTLRYSQESAEGSALVRIEVIDTGNGLSDDVKDRLFTPFERSTVGVPTKGTGLGLAIAKSLVSQMGGALVVDSAPGSGTQISVQLTLPEGDKAMEAEAA